MPQPLTKMSATEPLPKAVGTQGARAELSIAVLSVGSSQFPYAVRSITENNASVPYFVVADTRPVAASFNRMMAEAESDYVIQLDEDMELYEGAAERMLCRFKELEAVEPSLAQMAFRLEDPALGTIVGVKIFAVAKAGSVQMPQTQFSDRSYNQLLTEAGYTTVVDKGPPMGAHARNRSDYEYFIKCAVSASKFSRPQATPGPQAAGSGVPTSSDTRRFRHLFQRALEADFEQTFLSLAGLYWGIFNPVSTDISTYPADTYKRLELLLQPLLDQQQDDQLRELTRNCSEQINTCAQLETEPQYYTRLHYFGAGYQTLLRAVLNTSHAHWDMVGFGFGEIAVALQELGVLRGVHWDTLSDRRLDNPVTARLAQRVSFTRAVTSGADSASCGLVVPNVTGFTLAELTELVQGNYGTLVVHTEQLRKSKIDSQAFHLHLVQDQLWNTLLEENHITVYSRIDAD